MGYIELFESMFRVSWFKFLCLLKNKLTIIKAQFSLTPHHLFAEQCGLKTITAQFCEEMPKKYARRNACPPCVPFSVFFYEGWQLPEN
jgi:hypothetical protein